MKILSSMILALGVSVVGTAMVWADDSTRRQQSGVHLTLSTDVPVDAISDSDLVEMVRWFDAAVPQWMEFWGLAASRVDGWHLDAFVMQNVDAFRRSGDLPSSVPPFDFGFASPTRIWVRHQSSVYYDRHLLLHEGVHSLAIKLFGGGGPSWYMEGTAELLAMHRQPPEVTAFPERTDALLAQPKTAYRIREIPRSPAESPYWGRFRVVETHRQNASLPTLRRVLSLPMDLAGDVESYTWTWAAAMLMDAYPDTQSVFKAAAARGRDQSESFTAGFLREIRRNAPVVEARWRLMLHDLEYGFDWDRHRVALSTSDPRFDGRELELAIQADRSWQSCGVWFPAGTTLQIRAGGECVIARGTPNWISRPVGITAAFAGGRPIGELSVCVLPIQNEAARTLDPLAVSAAIDPIANMVINASQRFPYAGEPIRIVKPSWVLMRINDVSGELGRHQRADNQGHYDVLVRRR